MTVLFYAVNDSKQGVEGQQMCAVEPSHWKCILHHSVQKYADSSS